MKRKNIWKSGISLLLAAILLVSGAMVGTGVGASETKAAGLPTELEGYTKVTMEDFHLEASADLAGTKYEAMTEGSYTGGSLNKTYLDVDVNFHGSESNSRYFQYLHKSDWTQYVRVTHWGSGLSINEGANAQNSVWITEERNNEFVNLKLAVDMTANASDSSLSDIAVQIWIDHVLQGTLNFTASADALNGFFIYATQAEPISFRTPTEEQVIVPDMPEALEGYTRITMEDFGLEASADDAGTKYLAQAEGNYTKDSLDKTYLDVDVNFHGCTDGDRYFQYLHKSDWTQFVRVIHWGSGVSAYEGADNTNTVWMADVPNNAFFNMKLAVDLTENVNDNTKSDIVLTIWVDNVLQGTLCFTADVEELEKIYIVGGENTPISFRTPTIQTSEPEPEPEPEPVIPELEEALEGYTRVTVNDFEGLAAATSEEGTKYSAEASGIYTGETLNKTYLDVDVNFNGATGNFFHYLAETNWENYKRISCSESGVLFWDPFRTAVGSLWALIEADEYFNLKIRTDIAVNAEDETKEDVTVQLWVNDTYVGEKTWTEEIYTRNLFYIYVANGTLSLRTPTDGQEPEEPKEPEVSEVLKDYKQVTANDFAIVGGTFKHGWTEGNWMGYEYPESLDKTYLDVDIAFCEDANYHNSIRYLSMDGWQCLQIGIVEGELRMIETSTNTVMYKLPLSEIGIIADTFFNMKLSTDISVNASDSAKKDVTVRLWINDNMMQTVAGQNSIVVKGCAAVGNMLGVYVPNEGTISIKSTKSDAGNQEPSQTQQPDADFKKITFGSFAILDGTYEYADKALGAQGAYIFPVKSAVFSGDFHFSKESGADFRYGGKGNPWNGLRFWTTGDGKLYMQDATEKTSIYTFHPMYAGVQLVDATFNMKLSVSAVDSDGDGAKDDVKLGVWFNDVLYRNEYIYLTDYAKEMGNTCSVFVQKEDAWIQITSDKSVDTGVDFTLFGFTKNWKKELGIS